MNEVRDVRSGKASNCSDRKVTHTNIASCTFELLCSNSKKASSAVSDRRKKRTLLFPRALLADGDFEASMHELPRTLFSEVKLVFPDIASCCNREDERELLTVPTFHSASFSILEMNEGTDNERLRLFLRFKDYAADFLKELKNIDVSSVGDIPDIDGSATFSRSTVTIYDEVSSTRSLLGYSTFLYMGVQMVQHPRIHYSKLAVHTMVLFAKPGDAMEAFIRLENQYKLAKP